MVTDANVASIFPLELRQPDAAHTSARRASECRIFQPIAFPEVEFQDCSAEIDISRIRQLAEAHLKLHQEEDRTSPKDPVVSAIKLGKRRADDEVASDDQAKRVLRYRSQQLHAHTVCRYSVVARDFSAAESGKFLNEMAERNGDITLLTAGEIGSLQQILPKRASEQGDLISSVVTVRDTSSRHVVSLPIINTDNVDIAKSPHRFTNGQWLGAALGLSRRSAGSGKAEARQLLSINASLRLVRRPPAFTFESFVEAFVLELHLELNFDLEAASPSTPLLSAAELTDLNRVVRFIFCNDDEEAMIRSSRGLAASDIYSAMRSPVLPAVDSLQPNGLNAALFPFQRSALHFMLGRESVIVKNKDEAGTLILGQLEQGAMSYAGVQEVGLWWKKVADDLYFSPFLGKFVREAGETRLAEVKGGILAEEMGLGKTVEVYGLVLLHPDEARSDNPVYRDEDLEVSVAPTKTTLIVAPEVLRQQWLDEAALHAPELRTFSYMGYQDARKHVPKGKSWSDFARQFDVMIVSYDTLRKEVNVARKASSRSMRYDRKYERPRSLLIQLNFHRVVMDEVQLVGHSSAAETVSMIPRNYSLAVSGTPIKQLSDLRSLLGFLRAQGPIHSESHWTRLRSPEMLPSIVAAMHLLAARHTKKQVEMQMTLPQQTRILVPVTFTAVESAFYRDINQQARRAIGTDEFGDLSREQLLRALHERFGEDVTQLRGIVLALRQACTHPQISNRGQRGNVLNTSQTIRSMDEVLTIMIEGSKAEHASAVHSLYQSRIDRAVLLLQDKENRNRHDLALAMLQAMRPEMERHVEFLKSDLERAKRVGPLYRFDVSEMDKLPVELDNVEDAHTSKEQPKTQAEREREHDLAEKRALRRRHYNTVQARLRVLLEQLHRCHHFQGNVFFQMGEKMKEAKEALNTMDGVTLAEGRPGTDEQKLHEQRSDEESTQHQDKMASTSTLDEVARLKNAEDASYKSAEDVRQELLRFSQASVDLEVQQMNHAAPSFSLEGFKPNIDFGGSGIRSQEQFDTLALLLDKLVRQSELLFEWRDGIIQRLTKAVNRSVSEEDELDDQYQENLDAQAESEALLEMYRVLLSEREFMLTGVKIAGTLGRPQLYSQLDREVPHFQRLTKRLELWQMREDGDDSSRPIANDDYLPNEQELNVMKQQLEHFRKLEADKRNVAISAESKIRDSRRAARSREDGLADESGLMEQRLVPGEEKTKDDPRPFEEIRKELRDMSHKADGREEAFIARQGMEKIRQLVSEQKPMLERLKRESAHFSQTWNARAAYFKQMQELSDQVSDIQTANVAKHSSELELEEQTLRRRIDASEGRLRYLHAIQEEDDISDDGNEVRRTCPICTEPMEKAVVLDVCGHTTCAMCFSRWTKTRRSCPICRVNVNSRNVYHVTYGKKGAKRQKVELPEAQRRQFLTRLYNVLNDNVREDIERMPIHSALGTKLDMLMRHLLLIENSEEKQKSLIFTAFSRGISLVGDALRLNGIKFVTLESGGARGGKAVDRFKNDADVNVMLLHSEAQSSGLNLVCAQNIFLLEPLVNHSIELQAIGRVHRIGQTRPTSVFCYTVNDTVEERIIHLARHRSQSLFTPDKCISNTLRDSAEMTAKTAADRAKTAGRQGEFVASMSDLVECLVDSNNDPEDVNGDDKGAIGGSGSETGPRSGGASVSGMPTVKAECREVEDERARMRAERLRAVEMRQALASMEAERRRHAD